MQVLRVKNVTGIHLCRSLLLNKVIGLRKLELEIRTPPVDAFYPGSVLNYFFLSNEHLIGFSVLSHVGKIFSFKSNRKL